MDHHYESVVGLARDAVPGDGSSDSACATEHHCRRSTPSKAPGFAHAGFPIAADSTLTEAVEIRGARVWPGKPRSSRTRCRDWRRLSASAIPTDISCFCITGSDDAAVPYGVGGVGPDTLGDLFLLSSGVEGRPALLLRPLRIPMVGLVGPIRLPSVQRRSSRDQLHREPESGMFHLAFDVRDRSEVTRAADGAVVRATR